MVVELNGKITADSGIHRIGSAGSRNAVGIAVGALVEDIIDSDADLAKAVPEKTLAGIQVTQDKDGSADNHEGKFIHFGNSSGCACREIS